MKKLKRILFLFLTMASQITLKAQMPEVYPSATSVAASLPDVEPASIAVSETGRLFMALPRGGVNHNFPSVVEMVQGVAVAFPNDKVNENADGDLSSHLVSVLGLTLYKNTLWILDQGKRAGIDHIADGSTKIIGVDINTRKITSSIAIAKPFFRETMQLNDLRFDPTHGAQGTIYISNNGFAKPDQSLIVADVATGRLREIFKNAPEVSPVKGFLYFVEGKPHTFSYEHPTMPQGGVNGIELSRDFKKLYWTIPANPDFYSVATDSISNFDLPEEVLRKAIQPQGQIVSNGGITVDENDNLYFGDASRYSIIRKDKNGELSLVAYDPRLIWPDGLFYQNGYLYVSIGQWHRAPGMNGGKDLRLGPYQVLKIPIN